jgi:hypothetical protein
MVAFNRSKQAAPIGIMRAEESADERRARVAGSGFGTGRIWFGRLRPHGLLRHVCEKPTGGAGGLSFLSASAIPAGKRNSTRSLAS